MEYNMIATDFDSTLLTRDKKVSKKTKDILLRLKNDGYCIVGVTARNLSSVDDVCDIDMFNYLILSNGSYIYDVKNKKGKSISSINLDTINKIFYKYKDNGNGISFCSPFKYYLYTDSVSLFHDYEVNIKSLDEIKEEVNKINIFIYEKDIDSCINYINNNCSNVDSIVMQDTDGDNRKWITINNKNINKFTTLNRLCDDLDISTDEVIFFGDSTNDIEIIKGVGLGVAMGNALPVVKGIAKEVTLSNDEDGIFVFLNKLFYKK